VEEFLPRYGMIGKIVQRFSEKIMTNQRAKARFRFRPNLIAPLAPSLQGAWAAAMRRLQRV
jgi:hypothetical protein